MFAFAGRGSPTFVTSLWLEPGVPTILFELNVSLHFLPIIGYTAKSFSLRIDLLIGECFLF